MACESFPTTSIVKVWLSLGNKNWNDQLPTDVYHIPFEWMQAQWIKGEKYLL